MTSDITGPQMSRIDRIMMDEMGVDTLQLMELAGDRVADMARRHCGIDLTRNPRIVALAGTGGNGGDAMVAARLLHVWGADCTVVLTRAREDYTGITAHQLAILDRLGIPAIEPGLEALPAAELILDGLLGFSLHGDPRGETARLIALANDHPAPILAIDLPSGLDATTGEVGTPCITATWTVTLALPKTGLVHAPAIVTGNIWLADIGVPSVIYEKIGVNIPNDLFSHSSLICVR
ncbi:MAG TPA: NAD(P)H-hydrate epimerase [Thermomicrobiales bacterium]|nr:NAD(P)H-hydrate epimerase [Thermomicrobiales bacterium]